MSSQESKVLEFIPLNFDKVHDSEFSLSDFNRGKKLGSFLSGVISCLFNSGLKNEEISEIICKLIEKDYQVQGGK